MRSLSDTTVVFVDDAGGERLEGPELRLLTVARGCVEAGMHVHVICMPDSAVEREARRLGVKVNRYPLHAANVLRTRSRIRKYLKRYDAAIVQGTGFYTNMLVRWAGGPVGTWVLNTASCEPDAPLRAGSSRLSQPARDFVERITRTRMDLLVAVSNAVADEWGRRGVPRDKLVTIHSAIDAAAVRAAAQAGPKLAEEALAPLEPAGGASGSPAVFADGARHAPLVGMVARLQDVKGGETFVRAAAVLADARPDARFAVVGDGPERGRLEALSGSLGLGGRIAFTGTVTPAAPLIARFDVLAVPSLSEGLGHAAMEAMALGKPVVASCVGGLPEVVAEGETGSLVPPGDAGALAAAVAELLDDPARARAMGDAGRARVGEAFSSAGMVRAHLDLYRELLNRGA